MNCAVACRKLAGISGNTIKAGSTSDYQCDSIKSIWENSVSVECCDRLVSIRNP